MVKVVVNIESSGHELNWLILSGKQPSIIKAEKPKPVKSAVSEDAEDDKIAASSRHKNIYGHIIEKWTNLCHHPDVDAVRDGNLHLDFCVPCFSSMAENFILTLGRGWWRQ
jgi:hypothetical protein